MTYYGLGVSRNTTKGGNQLPRRRRGLRGAVLTVSLALVLVLVLAACSSSGSSTAASNKGSAPTTAGTGSPATVSPLPSKVVEMMGNASVAWVRSPSGASVGIVRYSFPGSGFAINCARTNCTFGPGSVMSTFSSFDRSRFYSVQVYQLPAGARPTLASAAAELACSRPIGHTRIAGVPADRCPPKVATDTVFVLELGFRVYQLIRPGADPAFGDRFERSMRAAS
jgi:hypothetical protein